MKRAQLRRVYIALGGAIVPVSAFAEAGGFGPEFGNRLAFAYFIILCAFCLPACLSWPGHSRNHRVAQVALGIGAPALGLIAGFAVSSIPAAEEAQVLLFIVASIIPVLAAIVYALAQRAKANFDARKRPLTNRWNGPCIIVAGRSTEALDVVRGSVAT